MIQKKKDKLKTEIDAVLSGEKFQDYLPIADGLIENSDARNVIAALLKIHYENDFDQSKYTDISQQRRDSSSNNGQVRLFVALGRREGYTAQSLLDLISTESGVPTREIDELKMMDDFSFISVSAKNAEIIAGAFANKAVGGKKAIINKAKEATGGRDYSPRSSGGGG